MADWQSPFNVYVKRKTTPNGEYSIAMFDYREGIFACIPHEVVVADQESTKCGKQVLVLHVSISQTVITVMAIYKL